tara:strand:+ start:384 stop:596 length:213 start_codon:yes stop_codon:yes gene_type:complete
MYTLRDNMKTFLNTFGLILIVLGVITASGAAGDCDGKCGTGNDIVTIAIILFGSVVSMGLGGIMLVKSAK